MKIKEIKWATDDATINKLGLPTEEEFLSNLDIDVNSEVLNDIANYLTDKCELHPPKGGCFLLHR